MPDPDVLATQLAILVDGAIAGALVRGDPGIARAAKQAARVLVAAAGVRISVEEAKARVSRKSSGSNQQPQKGNHYE